MVQQAEPAQDERTRSAPWPRWARRVLALAAVAALALALLPVLSSVLLTREAERAQGRLMQQRAALLDRLDRDAPLPYVIAASEDLAQVAAGAPAAALNARLARFAERTGAEAIYMMDATGLTVAASNHDAPDSFVGARYDFRPYFREAMAGRTGRHFAVGATTGRPGYFIAEPVRDGDAIVGVLAVKVSFRPLEAAWADGDPVFVTDAEGVVILSSDPVWRYRLARPAAAQAIRRARAERRYGGAALEPLPLMDAAGWRLPQAAEGAIHLTAEGLPHDWTLHYLADGGPARLRLAAVIAGLLALGAGAALVRQERRAGRVRLALGRSRAEGRLLRDANARLAVEIDERRTAEARLQAAQTELRRSSRLAALGQLAASVGHELSQPIAALRNHIAADAMRRDTDPSAQGLRLRLPDLVDRMEGIVRQLKLFGRPVEVSLSRLDLRDCVDGALALLAPNVDETDVRIDWRRPAAPVPAMGDAHRVEQVLVNLLRNALDAVGGEAERQVHVAAATAGGWAVVRVTDSGPGLEGRSLAELSEPFETTRSRSGGLGLGLAIASQILHEHGGDLRATDDPRGGAVFEMRLPAPDAEGAGTAAP